MGSEWIGWPRLQDIESRRFKSRRRLWQPQDNPFGNNKFREMDLPWQLCGLHSQVLSNPAAFPPPRVGMGRRFQVIDSTQPPDPPPLTPNRSTPQIQIRFLHWGTRPTSLLRALK